MSKSKNSPDLTTVLNNLRQDIFKNMNCIKIGQIESYDKETQTATISILLKKLLEIKADGTEVLGNYPLLVECPVFVLKGGSGYISMPITTGDECILLFNDRDIDNWQLEGKARKPNTYRTHDLSDCVALVGVSSSPNAIAGLKSNALTIAYGDVKIELDTKILLENSSQNLLTILTLFVNNLISATSVDNITPVFGSNTISQLNNIITQLNLLLK